MPQDFTAKFKVDISDLKKNITEARKEIKLANAAFKAGTAGMDDWKTDAEGLAKKLEQLKTVLNSQQRILESYRHQLERQEEAYQENGSRAEELRRKLQELADRGVDKASDEYKKYQTELKSVLKEQDNNAKSADDLKIKILNAEAAVGRTEKELRNYSNQLDHAGDEAQQLAKDTQAADAATQKLSGGFTVLKGVVTNLITDGLRKLGDELKSVVTDGAEYADEILTMSKQTGVATDTLQEFSYMSSLVDVDLSTVAGSLKKLTKNMDSARKGTGSAYEAFKDLGVSVTDANGNLRDNEDVFADVIGALGKMTNETERDAKSMTLFGKSATDLNPLIEAGADAIKGWTQEAHDMGYVMDDDMLGSLGELQDSFDRFDNQMTAIKNKIGAALAPALDAGIKKLEKFVSSVDWDKVGKEAGEALGKIIEALQWILENGDVVAAGIGVIIAAMAAEKIASIAKGFSSLKDVISGIIPVVQRLTGALMANPWIALVAVIAAAGAALIKWQSDLFAAERAADATWQQTDRLTESLETAAEAASEAAESYAGIDEAMESSVAAANAETEHIQSLADELKTLADENGKVAESDKARANFLLNELNQALGTEYTITGDVINQYEELKGSIDSLIQKKQAMLVLKAEEEAYTQAIVQGAEAEARLRELQAERLPIQDKLAANQARLNEIMASTGGYMYEHREEIGRLTNQNVQLTHALEDTQDEFDAVSETVDRSAWDIQQYTKNATAALEEDYDAISHKAFETAEETGEASRSASQAVIEEAESSHYAWLTTLSKTLSEMTGKQVEFRDAGNGMVEAYVNGEKQGEALPAEQFQAMAHQVMNHAQILNESITGSARNIGAGVAQGIYDSSGQAFSAVRWLADNILSEFNARMKIKSPSREMEWSAIQMIAGFNKGIKKDGKSAAKQMTILAGNIVTAFNQTLAAKSQGATEKYLKAVKDIMTANKKLYEDVNKLSEKLKKDIDSVNEKLKKDIDSVKKTLANDIAKVREDYQRAVQGRYDSTMGQLGILGGIEKNDALSANELTKNLEDQLKVLDDWSFYMDSLRERVKNGSLIAELEGLGLEDSGTLRSFYLMSDQQLEQYEKLYAKREQIALSQAKKASKAEKEDMEAQIRSLKDQARKDIEGLRKNAESEIAKLTAQYNKDLKKYGVNVTKTGTSVGQSIAEGILKGFTEKMSRADKETAPALYKMLDNIKKTLKIKSPSGMTKPFGRFLAEGLGVGFVDEMKVVNRDIERALPKAATFGALSGISGASSNSKVINNNYTQNIYTPKAPSRRDVYRDSRNLLKLLGRA